MSEVISKNSKLDTSFLKILPNILQSSIKKDIFYAVGVIFIMAILLMPMPKMLMDFLLAISITFSVMILMTSLFSAKPNEFSAFPTVLLIATMIRLSLNVASTRLILSNGHEGTAAAGKVIEAFGHFVMGGNFVIGIVVFAILVIVNFIVITKGSGRIAEVAARFSLDGMPGKQMAIDADLSAGLINEETAKTRRKELESESNFYGSMDGAAKFVRGDAIAGLLITFINVVGGIIIGVAQNDMSIWDASRTYTLLTVGDGLVTQIPALIVSMASGLLVSKSGIEGSTDQALFNQLSAYPAALAMASAVMLLMGILPGMPFIPFFALSLLSGYAAFITYQEQLEIEDQRKKEEEAERLAEEERKRKEAALAQLKNIPIDTIKVELGYSLLSLMNADKEHPLADQIKNIRLQMQQEIGISLPSIKIQDNMQLPEFDYVIKIKDLDAAKGTLKPNEFMVMNPNAQDIELDGEMTREPSFGLPAMWIDKNQVDSATNLGYTVIDPSVVLSTHLTETIKDNIAEIITYADVQKLLENLNETYKKLLNDIVPTHITVGGIQKILQNLLSERVSIKDLQTILEGIADICSHSKNLNNITEHVRMRLSRQITYLNVDHNNVLNIVTLSPYWEQIIAESIIGDYENRQLALAPSNMQDFIFKVNELYDRLAMLGEMPILLTSSVTRPFVRSILERVKPSVVILSQNEIHPKAQIRSLGSL